MENVVANHLSRIPNAPIEEEPINEDFPDEHILAIFKELWYADIINYLATGKYPLNGRSKIDIASSPTYGSPFWKSDTFSSTVLTKSSGGA